MSSCGLAGDMQPPVQMLFLPDPMAKWPWPRKLNKQYEETRAESDAWIRTFKAFTPASQRAFERGDFCLIASLAYPIHRKEHLRTTCDLMNFFFVIDEYSDVEDANAVREMVDAIVDALHNPDKPRPEGECIVGEIARQFWELAIKTATPSCQRHFIDTFTNYLNAVVEQAADRDIDIIRTIDDYIINRRNNVGIPPSCALVELPLNIPDEAFYHPVILELLGCVADLVWIGNDIVSYNKEQAMGEVRHNILSVVMNQFNCDFDNAMAWVVKYHAEVEAKFFDAMKRVPSWGNEVDEQVNAYIDGIGYWPRANDCWNFECGRYFGNKGLEVQKTRVVPLLPKLHLDHSLRRENVVVQLVDL